MKTRSNNFPRLAILLAAETILVLASACQQKTGSGQDLSGFAQCIADSGAKFYGAEWCSHCQAQKKAFGDAAAKLPYIECATPDGQGQTTVCKQAGIKSYPTWVFPDGSQQTGEMEFGELAVKTGCEAPK